MSVRQFCFILTLTYMQIAVYLYKSLCALRTSLQVSSAHRRVFCLVSILLIYGGSSVFAQDTNVAATIEKGIYEIRPLSDTTKTLDVGVTNKGNGDNVKQWESFGKPNQQWEITGVGDGYYRVSPIYDTTLCLDAAGTTLESTVRVWTYEGKPNQQWQFYEDNSFYEVASRSIVEGQDVPPLRMDVVGGKTTNNTNIQLYTDNNSAAQRWYLKRVGDVVAVDTGGTDNPVLATDDPVESSSRFSVYPNPAQSEVVWQRPVGEPATLTVVTLRGDLVKSQFVIGTQGTLTTDGLSRGIYFVTVQTPTKRYYQRLLIE